MYAFNSLFLLALPFMAVATPLVARTDTGSCNTGTVQCCDKTKQGSDPQTIPLIQGLLGPLGLLGSILDDLNLSQLVGIECSSVLSLDGPSCTQQTVCCSGLEFGPGLVNLNCVPISISL